MPIDPSRPPAVHLLGKLGMEPDSWQLDVLDGDQQRLLLNCCRQAGKSTVVAMLGLARALFVPGTKVLLVSRSHRQSKELFGIVTEFYRRFDKPMLERLSSEELRLTGEHYARQKPLSYHAERLPRDVDWYADPSGAAEISELRCASRIVNRGINALQLGIAAVTARLADGRLRIVEGACPNLLAEACLYRYPEQGEGGSEHPLDEHNHALAALRYLVSRIDERRMARRMAPNSSLKETQEEGHQGANSLEAQERHRQQLQHLWTHPGCWAS
jgi:hypothetical protein